MESVLVMTLFQVELGDSILDLHQVMLDFTIPACRHERSTAIEHLVKLIKKLHFGACAHFEGTHFLFIPETFGWENALVKVAKWTII